MISNPDFQTPNPVPAQLQDAVWSVHGPGTPGPSWNLGRLCAFRKEAGLAPQMPDDATAKTKDMWDELGPRGLWGEAGQP